MPFRVDDIVEANLSTDSLEIWHRARVLRINYPRVLVSCLDGPPRDLVTWLHYEKIRLCRPPPPQEVKFCFCFNKKSYQESGTGVNSHFI